MLTIKAVTIAVVSTVVPILLDASDAQGVERRVLTSRIPSAIATGRASRTGRLPGWVQLHLAIGLRLKDAEALKSLLNRISDPAAPDYRHYISPEQFAALF